MQSFSYFDRATIQKELEHTEFDLLIIGGGITGAGIALDAASRGMKVALVEKDDFASGTSSKSTKLVHGGLRYLKQFDFWLVKEVGTERAIVHQLAPHLVVPEKMLLPLIENGTYGTWLTSIGLKIYDILAAVEGDDKRVMLNKQEALQKEPLLPEQILHGAGYYAEYRTDDARLTLEIIKTARMYAASILNYTEAIGFTYENRRVSGVAVKDNFDQKEYTIKSKYVVNAAGPWVDDLRQLNHPTIGKRLHLTKGVHLVVPHEKFPVQQSVYFDVPDGRMMFAIPRGNVTYFGTTDTNYQKDKNSITVAMVDALYLLESVNAMFPEVSLTIEDVSSSWAGLRPLIHAEGKSPSELSRKDEIFVSDTELISIAGGKLTGYRKMAERVVDLVAKKMHKRFDQQFDSIQTANIPLTGGAFSNYNEVTTFAKEVYTKIQEFGFSKQDSEYLVHNYGKQCSVILDKLALLTNSNQEQRLLHAELWYSIEYEMACTPVDFLLRRTGKLFFNMPQVITHKEFVLDVFTKIFDWNSSTRLKHKSILDKHISNAITFS